MATEIIEIIDFSDCSSPLLSISDNNTPGLLEKTPNIATC
jgi:hypothetical protein